ncbi:dihydrodipicolinate synthase family protein [Streptacidiphilus sp. P02-A3a]|uniref:dihydrodipicolinate synthase family protein n=1 Tax=Streptacidiphilus sp. P02-A3a TaxID=2704468 RepID=UPI0015FB6F25|nr:dihydrodipicolinate synthase family protein [Streptacidiphilus sp. P02-A3a]QMU70163.1 dihydrodipicolinate synthase family protein [Streptacidiphilus sp. P02-A3a]QMU70387.1 dihydrodipicolinate synthase family protein [Streptacidiphilus sp. P02-A3a]
MSPSSAPTGLIPILATPFTASGELDVPSLRSLVEFQLAAGVDGLAVFGMASEGFALTTQERSVILREVRLVAGSGLPLVAGVNGTGTAVAIEQARQAAAGGADHLMVLPPFFVKPGRQQVIDFFGEVAAATDAGVMIQDAPGVTGVTIDVAAIATLAGAPGITSVKVEAPPTPLKVAAVTAAVPDGLTVLGGQNALSLIEEYDHGSVGTMPACEFSDLLRPVLDDLAAGRRARARAAFARLLPLIHIGMRPGQAWAVHKEVLCRRGIIASGTTRLPAQQSDPLTSRALAEILDDIQLPAWRKERV